MNEGIANRVANAPQVDLRKQTDGGGGTGKSRTINRELSASLSLPLQQNFFSVYSSKEPSELRLKPSVK